MEPRFIKVGCYVLNIAAIHGLTYQPNGDVVLAMAECCGYPPVLSFAGEEARALCAYFSGSGLVKDLLEAPL